MLALVSTCRAVEFSCCRFLEETTSQFDELPARRSTVVVTVDPAPPHGLALVELDGARLALLARADGTRSAAALASEVGAPAGASDGGAACPCAQSGTSPSRSSRTATMATPLTHAATSVSLGAR